MKPIARISWLCCKQCYACNTFSVVSTTSAQVNFRPEWVSHLAIAPSCFFQYLKICFCFHSYRENAARVSRSMRLRPRTSVQEAADWVEYMQALGGLPHLRPRSLDLPFYKLYLLDVLAVGLLLTIGIVLFFRYIIKSLIKKCCKEREKEKSYWPAVDSLSQAFRISTATEQGNRAQWIASGNRPVILSRSFFIHGAFVHDHTAWNTLAVLFFFLSPRYHCFSLKLR